MALLLNTQNLIAGTWSTYNMKNIEKYDTYNQAVRSIFASSYCMVIE